MQCSDTLAEDGEQPMSDQAVILAAFEIQAAYCDANDAPITASVCRAIAGALVENEFAAKTATGSAILNWPSNPVADGLVLRLVGGLHALWLEGKEPRLDLLFKGEAEPHEAAQEIATTLCDYDNQLLGWLDSPPQTNEPGRSAALITGILHIAARYPGKSIELLEIGSSAGLNLLIDRFAFNLGGVKVGPADSPVLIQPEWCGTPPPDVSIDILSVRGCDIQPIDATISDNEKRLLGYVWQDHPQRFDRVTKAIAMQRVKPVDLIQADAPDWVDARLAEPQAEGTLRILMHSIMWQYLTEEGKVRITAAMEAASVLATPDRPLGWVSVEADRNFNRHDIVIRSWPEHGEPLLIGHAHAHGFWVNHTAS